MDGRRSVANAQVLLHNERRQFTIFRNDRWLCGRISFLQGGKSERSQESAGNRVTRDTRDNNRTYAGQWSIFSSGQSRWRRTMAPSSARLSLRNSNYARLPRRIASAVGSTRFLRAIIFWQTMLFHYIAWNSFSYRRSIGRRYQVRETLDTLGVTYKLRSSW